MSFLFFFLLSFLSQMRFLVSPIYFLKHAFCLSVWLFFLLSFLSWTNFLANLIYIKGWVFFLSQMNIMDTPIYSKEFFSFFSSFLPFLNKLFGQPNIFKRRMNFLSVSLFFVFFLPFFLFPGPERTNVHPQVLTLLLLSLHMPASTCSLDLGNARICPLNFFLSRAGLLNLWTLDLW